MKYSLMVIVLTFSLNTMNAQILTRQVSIDALGIRFDIPEGWTGKMEEDYIFLGHETIPGLMVLFENNSGSAEDLRRIAMEGIVEEGIRLKPKEDFIKINEKRVEGMYSGNYNGTDVQGFAIGLINDHGSGMSVLILTETEMFSEVHKEEAQKLVKTVAFFEPKEHEDVVRWKNWLVGTSLKYLKSSSDLDYDGGYSGSSTTKIINLCTNGRFNYYFNSHASTSTSLGGGAYANSNADSEGEYEIYYEDNESWLDLHFDNNTIHTYKLTTDSNNQQTLLNGSRFFVAGEAECQN